MRDNILFLVEMLNKHTFFQRPNELEKILSNDNGQDLLTELIQYRKTIGKRIMDSQNKYLEETYGLNK